MNEAKHFLKITTALISKIEDSELDTDKKIHILEAVSNKALAAKQFLFLQSTQHLENDDVMNWRY